MELRQHDKEPAPAEVRLKQTSEFGTSLKVSTRIKDNLGKATKQI